jgi:hypothetical protein
MPPSRLPNSIGARPTLSFTAASRPTPLPLLPILAASLIIIGGAMLGRWLYTLNQQTVPVQAAQGNPFAALIDLRQRHAIATTMLQRQPRQVELPASPPLQVLGDPQGRVTLTLLFDPVNAAHRQQLTNWLELSGRNVRVELRFTPAQENESSGSLAGSVVWQLAARFNKTTSLWQALQASQINLTETELLALLAAQGIELGQIRNELTAANSPLIRNAQAAATWAELNGLNAPMALIDGLVVDGQVLQPELLATYLQRRLAGEDLVQVDDYLLMNKR